MFAINLFVLCSIAAACCFFFVRADRCKYNVTLDISDGVLDRWTGAVTKDRVRYGPRDYYVESGVSRGCVCNVRVCLRKCCPAGTALINRTCTAYAGQELTVKTYSRDVFVEEKRVDAANFHLLDVNFCPRQKYSLDPDVDYDRFNVQTDGRLLFVNLDDDDNNEVLPIDYCLDWFGPDAGNVRLNAKVCGQSSGDGAAKVFYSTGMMISVPFLLVTLLVYAVLPEKRNLHGKCLMFYVSSLMLAYCFLIYIQLKSTLSSDPPLCISIGVLCLFFFLVSFFWMNVMCTDIWLTFRYHFSGKRNASEARKDNRRILFYGIYAVGIPVLLAVIVIVLNITLQDSKNSVFYPGIGEGQCFVISGIPTLIYFYGPMSALITLNVFFFVKTAITIKSIKKDTKILKRKESMAHRNDDEKQQMFKLYIKLLLVMGINWTMEIISWAVIWANNNQTPPEIWYFTDFCNALYGVFIFFIFVFKKKTWQSLKRRYYVFIGKPMQAHMTGSTQTRSSAVTSDCGEPEGGAMAMRSTAKPI